MALGLNIVVGFAGLLDLGYVAFYAIGAFVIGWFGSQQFPDVNGGKGIHILSRRATFQLKLDGSQAGIPGIHINFFIVTSSRWRSPRCGASCSARRRCGCAATTWRS